MAVVGIGILTGVLASAGRPVSAQENYQPVPLETSSLIAQTDDQTDPPVDDQAPANSDATPAQEGEEGAEAEDFGVTCEGSVGTMGWVICPVIRITYEGFNFLVTNVLEDGLLRIDIMGDGEEELRAAWAGFRTLANLLFVLAFFAIIYAEATGRVGMLETFSATRMLPKIAISVMGIQLSYFICAYLIGLFNDLGEGVTAIVLAPVQGFDTFELTFTDFGDGNFFGLDAEIGEGFVDSFIGIAAVAVVGWIAYIVLETVLIMAVFGLALMFFTLILRKILIVALTVTSPIAFAAWVLPGTDRVFKLWWDSLIKSLAMYPLIMLFIASGQLVGRLAVAGDASFIDSMVSIIATFAPLFLIPATFRLAGAAVATVGGFIGGMTEKGKGDMRDPNSTRARLRQKRLQRYGRLMGGDVRTPSKVGGQRFNIPLGPLGRRSLMPSSIARAYNRIPSTNASSGLIGDILKGREDVSTIAKTLGDDVVKATAVTGGGYNKGLKIRTTTGYEWSGYKKLGKHYAIDPMTGRIATHNGRSDGIAMMMGANGEMVPATSKDFYDKDIMSQVAKYAPNRGFMAASMEHTMTKTDNNNYRDQQQIWDGLNASKWTKEEKIKMSQGVWNTVKDQGIHHKFSDWGAFYETAPTPLVDPSNGVVNTKKMGVKFNDLVNFIDGEMQQYPIQNQKAPAWNALNKGLVDYATKVDPATGTTAKQRDISNPIAEEQTRVKLRSLAYKARNLVDQNRPVGGPGGTPIPAGDDDEVIAAGGSVAYGSSATGSAAREARRFLELYKQHIGDVPGGDRGVLDTPPDFH